MDIQFGLRVRVKVSVFVLPARRKYKLVKLVIIMIELLLFKKLPPVAIHSRATRKQGGNAVGYVG